MRSASSASASTGWDARLVATVLSAEWGIALRDGRFCAHPLLERLGVEGPALRASVGLGSTLADVEALIGALRSLLADGPRWTYDLVDGQFVARDDHRPRPDWAPALDASLTSYGCAA